MAAILGCRAGNLPFKHLGLIVGANMNLSRNWKPVVDTFKQRAPVQIIDQLERIRRDFLWGANQEQSKINWVAWHNAMAPKDRGGLGIGSLREANLAMLAKWWWRFKSERNNLWWKVIWSVHHGSRAWNFIPVKLSVAGPWKQIAKVSQDLESYAVDIVSLFKCKLGDGKSIHFWRDKWLLEDSLNTKFPLLYNLDLNKKATVADRVCEVNGIITIKFQWSRELNSVEELIQFEDLMEVLWDIQIGEGEDVWNWSLEGSGVYSVGSLRRRLQSERFLDSGIVYVWNKWTPIKVNFFCWRVIINRVPTMDALVRRNVQIDSVRCRFCNCQDESVEHLFVACEFAQSVWDFVASWTRCPRFFIFGIKDLFEAYKHEVGTRRWKMTVYSVIQIAVWCIWKCRNDMIFNNKQPNIIGVKEQIRHLGYIWIRNRARAQVITWEQWCEFDLSCMSL
ncbi:putative reverse transcriptase zinc-binding domain-containing protein [Helianthus annuus]|nr:putative reverse transcriptase zinc-binding domain-containing protein [Helianthus annuus]